MRSQTKVCPDPVASVTGKPPINELPLLSHDQAAEVVALFQVLANDSRLRMLHALARADELSVGALASAVGMTPQAVSNQLRRLVDRRVVAARRDGNHIRYRIVDPCVPGLLALGVCLAEETGKIGRIQAASPRGRSRGGTRRRPPSAKRQRSQRKV